MTELEEMNIKLNDHDHEIGSLKRRVEKCENQQESINGLIHSVDKLAFTVESMVNEQKEMKQEVKELREAPIEKFNYYKRTIITCIVTAIVGALIGAALTFIIKGGV